MDVSNDQVIKFGVVVIVFFMFYMAYYIYKKVKGDDAIDQEDLWGLFKRQ